MFRRGGPTLVLRRFKVAETTSADVLLEIVGRASGFIAWLLSVMGIGAETSLKVTGKEVTFRSSSLFGQAYQIVPLPKVASTHCGYSKPVGYLILGAILLAFGLFKALDKRHDDSLAMISGLLLGAIFLIAYYVSKRIVISVETSGGLVLGLRFKGSVVENVSVDIEQALKAIYVVNQKVIESQVR